MFTRAKWIYVFVGICSGVLSKTVNSADSAAEPFPGYRKTCDYPIIVTPTPNVSQAVIDASGHQIILIDPVLETGIEAVRKTFLIAHECAHHKMGHAEPASLQLRILSFRVVRDQEMSADCWAAETLARVGQDRVVRVMADRFLRSGYYSPGSGYPSGQQRSNIIDQCAKTGRAARARPEVNPKE